MRERRKLSEIDFAMLALVIFQIVFFAKLSWNAGRMAMVAMVLALGTISWSSLRWQRYVSGWVRTIIAAISGCLVYFIGYLPKQISHGDMRAMMLFLGLFCLFSTSPTRLGGALRLMCGLFAGIFIMAEIPAIFGVSLGLCVLLVIVGGWISLWSDMGLGRAILWFAKRSIRRETIFLILFLAGIAAIGVRQAQNYASAQAGLSGLAASIAPGSLDSLTLSPALAMRVKLVQLPPLDMTQAYFRSAAMDVVDGFKWLQGPSRLRRQVPDVAVTIAYKLELSPRFSDYAPVLDYGLKLRHLEPDSETSRQTFGRDSGVFFPAVVTSSWQKYEGMSALTPAHQLAAEDRARLLQMSKSVDARVIERAHQLSQGPGGVKGFMSRLAAMFRDEGFRYTLGGSGASRNLEDFLLQGRAGYCEHYAAASATLARLSGIPARVVAGFLGGDWDHESLTLYVRDMDAHAWAEFWDDATQRWERFDGVQFVAPTRISLGAEQYLRSVGADIPDAATLRQKIWMSQFLMALDEFLASLRNTSVLSAAGSLVDYGEEMALMGVFGLTMSYVLLRIRRNRALRANPHRPHLQRMESILARHGLARLTGEPVRLWLERAATRIEFVAPELRAFGMAHDRYCYSAKAQYQDVTMMASLAKRTRTKLSSGKDFYKTINSHK